MDRNIDWNTNNAHPHHTNTTEPRFLTSEVWLNELNDGIEGTGVEIIELDSMDESQTSLEDPYENIQNMSHAWSYINANRFQELENSYKVNRQARLKRRLRNKKLFTANDSFDSEFDDSFYFNTDHNTAEPTDDVVTLNQQTNCFTTLNRHSAPESDSSSDDLEDAVVEATRCDGACEEVVTSYNSEQGGERRTVWIYSFKNRRLLSENDFELVNIPSQTDSCSTSDSPESEVHNSSTGTYVGRVASPIPKPYIPRLNLSAAVTLPNVTEVTEPKSSQTLKQNKEQRSMPHKPVNGWILDKTEKTEEVSKHDKSTNIVNWMALSPRERRRRSRHTNRDIQNTAQLLAVPEIVCDTEEKKEGKLHDGEHFEAKITEESGVSRVPSQMNTQRTINDQQTEMKPDVESPMGDRGDYNKCVQRPHIRFNHNQSLAPPTVITEPIEKLDSNGWIAESEPKSCYEYDSMPVDADNETAHDEIDRTSAGDRLMLRNMSLLKPAEWGEYSPIAGSRLSIELSLGPSDADRTSLLQRCVNCFKCCKYRF